MAGDRILSRERVVFRIVLRNLFIMLGVALPILLVSAPLVGWVLSSPWRGGRGVASPSFEDFLASFVFWYPIWTLPALAIAALHQLVFAAFPRNWSARTTRLVILATSLGTGASIVGYVASKSTSARGLALALALLPSAVAYGVLAQPLRRGEPERPPRSE